MDIQDLIKEQTAFFGAKWIQCTVNPILMNNMVNILTNLFEEGLSEAYKLGLQKKEDLIKSK